MISSDRPDMDRWLNSDTVNKSTEIKVIGSVFAYTECGNFFFRSLKENGKQKKKKPAIYILRTKPKQTSVAVVAAVVDGTVSAKRSTKYNLSHLNYFLG